jgi:hypothetical protein
MKIHMTISRDSGGKLKAEYLGGDGQAAREAAQDASEKGMDAFIYSKPIAFKRVAAVQKLQPKK